MCLTRLGVTSSDFKSRRWHQLGRRNSALPSFDGPGVSDFNQRMDRESHNAISRPDTAGGSTAKVVLASCCPGPGFSASTLAQHSAVALRNERNKWTNMENIGNWHSCPQLQITAGNIQVVCQEAGEEAWPWHFVQTSLGSFSNPARITVGYSVFPCSLLALRCRCVFGGICRVSSTC